MTRLIIDTDTAQDDAIALLLALASPATVEAVTVVAGNVGFAQEIENALYTIELAGGPAKVPVHPGCAQPLMRPWFGAEEYHGTDGMGDAGHPRASQRPEPRHAVDLIVDSVVAAPGEITLVAIGPLTNIAMAVRREPEIAGRVRHLYVMGGTNNGIGNVTPAAEFNFYVDPEAAQIVLGAGFPLTLVDWTLTRRQGVVTAAELEAIAALDTERSRFFTCITRLALNYCRGIGIEGIPQPDALACALAIDDGLVTRSRRCRVDVETRGELTRGYCSVDWNDALGLEPNARIVDEIDRERFMRMLMDSLGTA